MKKVLFVVTSLEVGGIETYLLRFLRFADADINSTVFCKGGRSGALENDYKQVRTNIILFKLNYLSFVDYWKLYKYLKKNNFDTVCDFTGDFAGALLLVSKISGVHNRLAFYRGSAYQFRQTIIKMIYAKFMNILVQRFATKILSNSETALNNFHSNWKTNPAFYEVIHNGIPTFEKISAKQRDLIRSTFGISTDAFVIGHVGRYMPAKNHKQILKIADILLKRHKNLFFFLCGRGVKDSLEYTVKQMKNGHRIILYNSRDDIPQLLQCFDGFYFPSLSEGQPNALLEAMMAGLPFVASNIDSIKEAVPEEYYSYLTPINDINSTVELFESFIEDKSKFSSQKLLKWTQNHYNAEKLFTKFLVNL